MKKLVLNLSLVGLLFVSVSWGKVDTAIEENEFCAGVAWEAADQICAMSLTGCTEAQIYDLTNTAYNVCMTTQD